MKEDAKMKIYNFESEEKSPRLYGGDTDWKQGIYINNIPYMLKIQRTYKDKKTGNLFRRNSTLCEYICSKIGSNLKLNMQEVELGIYDGRIAVACRDFIDYKNNFELIPYLAIYNSNFDEAGEKQKEYEKYVYSIVPQNKRVSFYNELEIVKITIDYNHTIKQCIDLNKQFWDMFVFDFLIGNEKRTIYDFGVLSNKKDTIKLSPIFDNGASFFYKLQENDIKEVLNSDDKFKEACFDIKSHFTYLGNKINYVEYISSCKTKDLNQAILRIVPNINLNEIKKIIYEIPNEDEKTKIKIISDVQKEFYYKVLKARYEEILLPCYKKLQ